ncbi:MAG TPA: hypothetical protein VGU27_01950, partial [Candidatus Eisenbacteria bacterium]|nr:hypothetical protein [Candidatus Eisenbacteria bacterium]
QGAYGLAAARLRALRGRVAPDADLELFLALDDARSGRADSAWARLHGPVLAAALADTAGVARRVDYPFQHEAWLLNGRFDGWCWYVARARAELALDRRAWREAMAMAGRCVQARPLSGDDLLLLAVAAGRAGDDSLAEAAAGSAVYLAPALPEARYLYGLWAWRRGRRSAAADQFRAAVALDSAYRAPALALTRLLLPGLRPDSLPGSFLTGPRACAMLTSPERPKLEEFVQFDTQPVVVTNASTPPADSLRRAMHLVRPLQLYVQVLVSEGGRPLLAELPYASEAVLPPAVAQHVLAEIATWRFVAPTRFGRPQRAWATVEYDIQP